MCTCFAWKGHPQNDLYCVGQDVKPYSLTHAMSTNESWEVNRHTEWCNSHVSVVLQSKLVSVWGLRKQRSKPHYVPNILGSLSCSTFFSDRRVMMAMMMTFDVCR